MYYSNIRLIRLAFVSAITTMTMPTLAADDVNLGTLFTLTNTATAPNGAWSWYEDERAIVDLNDPANPMLLVSSVSDGGGAEEGDIDLLWRNLATGAQGEFEFNDTLQADDHNSAALQILPDGRYLASYSRHGNDDLTRWRISNNPHDPTAWGPEQTLDNNTNNGTTYNNTYYLPNDDGGNGRLYNFTRNQNFDPNVQTWDSTNEQWDYRGKLLTQGNNSTRPYLRYASDGEKIHFIATEQHPRNFANNIYHGYVKDGQLFDTDGTVIDPNIFNASGASATSLTKIFSNGSQFDGTTMNRAWTISMEVDDASNPVAVFSARANDSDQDHRFFYARHDGDDWVVNPLAKAGGYLYAAENDYTGLVSIDPNDADVVYLSSDIDPITGLGTTSGKYEIYQGVTENLGGSWDWTAITANSTVDNIRPVVPDWDASNTALLWMRGNYTTYQDWDSEIVGISFPTDTLKAWNGSTGASTWDTGSTSAWLNSGDAAVFNEGDQANFDDSAFSTFVNIAGSVQPSNTLFNNQNRAYFVTGGGIGGSGRLTVAGGGAVTLANGNNTYAGDTRINSGTLALVGSAALTQTPQIDVAAGATLDVTGRTGGVYTLTGQALSISGEVKGQIYATGGSTVSLNTNNAIVGDLIAADALVKGLGGIDGSLTAQSGATIQVGDTGFHVQVIESAGPVTYVDADFNTNVTQPNGNAAVQGVHYDNIGGGTALANDRWDIRAFGNNNTVFSSNNTGGEDAPPLRVTIDGLVPGQAIEVFAYTWGNSLWGLRADLVGPNDDGTADGQVDRGWNTNHSQGSAFEAMAYLTNNDSGSSQNPGPLSTATGGDPRYENGGYFANGTGIIETKESNRSLYQAALGVQSADANGEVFVYFDDLANVTDANRTFFDGVGYRITDPTNIVAQTNTLTIAGDVTLEAGATLLLDIYGPTALDKLSVGGMLTAAGLFDIDLLEDAPSPQLGDRFDVLDFTSIQGTFDTLELPSLEPGLFWETATLYSTGEISVVDHLPMPGDTDQDGDVDDSDLGTSFANYTGPIGAAGGKSLTDGDTDGDGDVDDSDLGTSFSAYTGPLGPSTVPEPSSLILLAAGGLLGARTRSRRPFRSINLTQE